MNNIADLLKRQFRAWLAKRNNISAFDRYIAVANSISQAYMGNAKEKDIFEITNISRIEQILDNISKTKINRDSKLEFIRVYIWFLIEEDHFSGLSILDFSRETNYNNTVPKYWIYRGQFHDDCLSWKELLKKAASCLCADFSQKMISFYGLSSAINGNISPDTLAPAIVGIIDKEKSDSNAVVKTLEKLIALCGIEQNRFVVVYRINHDNTSSVRVSAPKKQMHSAKEIINIFVSSGIDNCKEEYLKLYEISDDDTFYEAVKRNRQRKGALHDLSLEFDKTAEIFVLNASYWKNDAERIKGRIQSFFNEEFLNADGEPDIVRLKSFYLEISAFFKETSDQLKRQWDAAWENDDDSDDILMIRSYRKKIAKISDAVDSLYEAFEHYCRVSGGDEKTQQSESGYNQCETEIQQAPKIPIAAEDGSLDTGSEYDVPSVTEDKHEVKPELASIFDSLKRENMSTQKVDHNSAEGVKPNLIINGNDILVYDWCDVIRRVCEYAINAKPFAMAAFRAKSVTINGMPAFNRDVELKSGYIRLSNGLQVIGANDRASCMSICSVVCEHCGLRDRISIK